MSFLTPLYLLGAIAIAAPVIFHLIRRSPRGEVPFSSLMFLAPSAPRLTRRSRLDHILLLLLRAAALILLALGFTRPFWRQAADLSLGDAARRRVAVLIDTSASMRRGNLWARAKELAGEAIAGCRSSDQLAVFSFDASARPLLGFEESKALDLSRRQAVAQARLDSLVPAWGSTGLGQALIDTVAAVEDVVDASEKAGRMPRRIVLISDLQRGSRLESLGDFEWPSDVELELKRVAADGSNAGLEWLASPADAEPDDAARRLRVRVSNEPGSRREALQLQWQDEKRAAVAAPVDVYVPPGESRVVRVPRPPNNPAARLLRLKGDTQDFDNTLYLAVAPRQDATVLYVGADKADDPAGLLYYLDRAVGDTPGRHLRVRAVPPPAALTSDSEHALSLVVLAAETTPGNSGRLRAYLNGGGTVLCVVTSPGSLRTLAALADASTCDAEEAAVGRDVLLGEIAFNHPLFAPMAGAQFNDFTKIHFWKYRRISAKALGDARVLARFETGDAAILEKSIGKGRLVILASGWSPADSQLARSSKFVPFLAALLEGPDARPIGAMNLHIHDRVPLPAAVLAGAKPLVVHKPDGTTAELAPGGESFSGADEPGVYTIDTVDGARSFAVNLDPAESRTAPLEVETLEQLGCRLVASPSRKAADRERLRQMHNAELEGRQKFWRWLIVGTIGVLIAETFLAGRLVQSRQAEDPAS